LEVKLKQVFSKFLNDESGATAIEYGLIAAGIALAIIAVVNGLGTNLNDKFTRRRRPPKSAMTSSGIVIRSIFLFGPRRLALASRQEKRAA
jgi:pilus assembly protein Flp/PilA